jgi:acyl-CoA thioesterase-1
VRGATASLRTFAVGTALLLLCGGTAAADNIGIVVFGDSSTFGSGPGGRGARTGQLGGVPLSEAFAAKLQSALRARGWNVSVADESSPGKLASGAAGLISSQIPVGTRLTIVALGTTDINYRHASREEVALDIDNVVNALHARQSLVILVRRWGSAPTTAFDAIIAKADLYVEWFSGLTAGPSVLRPEYDSGDGEHLNAVGIDVLVARAIPDVERVLSTHGFRSGQ